MMARSQPIGQDGCSHALFVLDKGQLTFANIHLRRNRL